MQRFMVAGLPPKFNTRFPSTMEKLFAGYSDDGQVEAAPVLTLDPESWIKDIADETGQGPEAVEFYAVSAALGDMLPEYRRLQTHGVAIEYDGNAYIFSAPSGTGKSTRAFLWQKYLGEQNVTIINGDKPILWFKEDTVLACGSPWSGKEGLEKIEEIYAEVPIFTLENDMSEQGVRVAFEALTGMDYEKHKI